MIIYVTAHEFHMEWENEIFNHDYPVVLIFMADTAVNTIPSYIDVIDISCESNCIRGLLLLPGTTDADLLQDLSISSLPRVVIYQRGEQILNEDPWTDLDRIIETIEHI